MWSREYDASHNVARIVDANGTLISQSHDPANRLTGRVVTRAPGVVGPEVESYVYDGLYRLTRAQSGQVATDFEYDSASRLLSDTTAGRAVRYAHDDVDNPTQLTYPSGVVIDQVFDDLDRPEAVGQRIGPETLREAVRYRYRGPYLQKRKTLGNGVDLVREFDPARRLLREVGRTLSGSRVFDEQLTWSRRSLKTSETRSDLGRFAQVMGYDGAKRVDTAARVLLPESEEPLIPANRRIAPEVLDEAPEQFRFGYDPAQNLVATVAVSDGVASGATMPPDPSGRNRPASVGGVDLSYDANGNLTGRGEETLSYDFRNRLTQVRAGDGSLVASYAYDAFNRRVERQVGSTTEETVWNAWQAVEEYVNGTLSQRRVFGRGLDEIVLAQADVDGDGSLETEYSPLYDETGNLVALTGSGGQVFERYDYSPFGLSRTRVDAKPPAMGQVLLRNGRLRLEFDEPIQGEELRDAVGDGRLQLEQIFGDGTTEPVPVVSEQEADFVPEIPPLEPQGLMAESARAETDERSSVDDLMGATVGARSTAPLASGQAIHFRRVFLRPTQPLEDGTQVRLTVATEAIQDRFQNQASAGIDETFAWAGTGTQIVADLAPPEVRAVRLKGNRLEIEFSEQPDLGTLGAIELGPATAGLEGLELGTSEQPTWHLQDDSVTVITEEPLPSGERQLTVGSGLRDLSGKSLPESFQFNVEVPAILTSVELFEVDDEEVLDFSTVGHRHGFHGRPVDAETGLMYFRNRYYDPEIGRFISADPLGYVDGPSMYGFAGYSPMNFWDPLGLCFAGVTCREWLGEIFSSEGMKRSGRFLKGEAIGAGHAVKVTAQGAYQLVRHPIQTTQTVVEGAVEGSASLVVNADRVPTQLAEAGRALRDASPEEQGKVTGEVLAGVLMGGAAGKGAKAVKSLVDFDDLADAGMVGFREGLEEAVDGMTPGTAVSRGTASSLVPRGGLAAHEAAGGHLLARHVGQTEAQLSARLAAQPRIPAASTFVTRAEAEAGVSAVLAANATRLSNWVSSGAQGQLVLRGSFNGGMVLQRGAATGSTGSGVVVVLRGTGGGAWRVHTGYPIP